MRTINWNKDRNRARLSKKWRLSVLFSIQTNIAFIIKLPIHRKQFLTYAELQKYLLFSRIIFSNKMSKPIRVELWSLILDMLHSAGKTFKMFCKENCLARKSRKTVHYYPCTGWIFYRVTNSFIFGALKSM